MSLGFGPYGALQGVDASGGSIFGKMMGGRCIIALVRPIARHGKANP